MATLSEYNVSVPVDDEMAGKGAEKIRDLATAIKERISGTAGELDHYMDESLDTTNPKCDGMHRKITLPVLATDPEMLADSGVIYTKTIGGTQGLYFRNSAGIKRLI